MSIGGSLRARIAVSFLALLALVQVAVLLVVHVANLRNAREQVGREVMVAGRMFDRLIDMRDGQLAQAARLLARDLALARPAAYPALVSAMQDARARIKADIVMLGALDGTIVASTAADRRGQRFPLPDLLPGLMSTAHRTGRALALVSIDGVLYEAVVAPAPAGWVLVGFRIDDALAADLQALTATHVTFVQQTSLVASTLPATLRPALAGVLVRPLPAAVESVNLGDGEYVTLVLTRGGPGAVRVVLQRSLTEAVASYRRLELTLLALFVAGLVGAVVVGRRIARTVNRPLLALAEGARKIGYGDYAQRVAVTQPDELGELASAFNDMADGISEREAQLKYQAYHDGLTGLPNRALFQYLLEQAVQQARREQRQLAVLVLDLDRFKEVNDTLGHNIGDLLLQQVGPRLQAAVRGADTVARLGGDECAVLLRGIEAERDATDVVRRIREALERPFLIEEQPLDLSASVGIAFYPQHGEDGATLMRRADVAMYVAKRLATGVVIYSPEMEHAGPRRLALVGELRRALEDGGGLVLHYQPKIDLRTGRVTGVEALVRWQHPQRGLLPPRDFIPVAEQSGLVEPLTWWVLEEALRQWTEWRELGIELGVAINLPARLLQDEHFPERVREVLARWMVEPAALALEITERAIMADRACTVRIVARLHALGVRLCVEDFGTGYSSLTYLNDLAVDELKIDGSLVTDVERESHGAIVRAAIDLAHRLDITVTAQGVETHEACEMLRQHGCDQLQGDLVSRPLPARELTRWLQDGQGTAALTTDNFAR